MKGTFLLAFPLSKSKRYFARKQARISIERQKLLVWRKVGWLIVGLSAALIELERR
jgi:hypothetical protein